MQSYSGTKPGDGETDEHANELLREWQESAFYWQKHHETIRTMFAPLTQALIEDAEIGTGDSVLDVAGGSGEPSLTLAEIVGPNGTVTFTDVTGEMVAIAKSEAERRGLTNMQFQRCSADWLPFEDNSFDGVVCRLGVMLFCDPPGALREMLRVTRGGGAVSLVVCDNSELNPFFYVVSGVVARHFDSPPADPEEPGPFRFAEAGVLAGLLEEAGGTKVRERKVKFDMVAPISPQELWEMRSEMSATLREKLSSVSQTEAEVIGRE